MLITITGMILLTAWILWLWDEKSPVGKIVNNFLKKVLEKFSNPKN
tara:strand:+ start:291 stop:428 length:138 start_codon:yes stop_codon:yes gene_type:complete